MTEFFTQLFCDADPSYSVVIEDDGKVAYAYLYEDETIIGDVWLYNQQTAPPVTNWKEEDMPFLNPLEYIKPKISIAPVTHHHDIVCDWILADEGKIIKAGILLRGVFIAQLQKGFKPGWSALVQKDGPLALKKIS